MFFEVRLGLIGIYVLTKMLTHSRQCSATGFKAPWYKTVRTPTDKSVWGMIQIAQSCTLTLRKQTQKYAWFKKLWLSNFSFRLLLSIEKYGFGPSSLQTSGWCNPCKFVFCVVWGCNFLHKWLCHCYMLSMSFQHDIIGHQPGELWIHMASWTLYVLVGALNVCNDRPPIVP